MAVHIIDTTIVPALDELLVSISVGDGRLEPDGKLPSYASLHMTLTCRIPKRENPYLATIQEDALRRANDAVIPLLLVLGRQAIGENPIPVAKKR